MQIQLNFAVIRQRRLRLRLRLRLSSEQRVVGLSAVSPGLFALFAHTHTHCAGLSFGLGFTRLQLQLPLSLVLRQLPKLTLPLIEGALRTTPLQTATATDADAAAAAAATDADGDADVLCPVSLSIAAKSPPSRDESMMMGNCLWHALRPARHVWAE